MILGVGAGWNEPDHMMFGYQLGDVATRMARLEDGLEVITRLLCNAGPTSYRGPFFCLREAQLLPQPQRPGGPRLMIGGTGPRRTLPLVARFADLWNAGFLTPNEFVQRAAHLDRLIRAAGRQPSDVKRTVTVPVICGRDTAELEARASAWRRWGASNVPLNDLLVGLRGLAPVVGTPEEVVAQLRAYEGVGVDEIMAQWAGVDDIEGLEALADEVLPHVIA